MTNLIKIIRAFADSQEKSLALLLNELHHVSLGDQLFWVYLSCSVDIPNLQDLPQKVGTRWAGTLFIVYCSSQLSRKTEACCLTLIKIQPLCSANAFRSDDYEHTLSQRNSPEAAVEYDNLSGLV